MTTSVIDKRAKRKIAYKKWYYQNQDYFKDYYQTHHELIITRQRKYDNEPTRIFSNYKKQAKRRNYDFMLSYEQFMAYWQKPCIYCGTAIKTIGIDRIDNTKGYIDGNVAPCCFTCNKWKQAETQQDFVNHCKAVAEHFK